MTILDNYYLYQQYELRQEQKYERYRQMYLDGDIDEEE
jgi:hypothetical protein